MKIKETQRINVKNTASDSQGSQWRRIADVKL